MNDIIGLPLLIIAALSLLLAVSTGSVAAYIIFLMSAASIWTNEFK